MNDIVDVMLERITNILNEKMRILEDTVTKQESQLNTAKKEKEEWKSLYKQHKKEYEDSILELTHCREVEVPDLDQKLNTAKKALEQYADEGNWSKYVFGDVTKENPINLFSADFGFKLAQETLEELNKEKKKE